MPSLRQLIGIIRQSRSRNLWAESPAASFLERSRLVAGLIFVATVFAIMLISYQGVSTAEIPLLPGQIATVSVHAGADFSFESREQTRMRGERLKTQLPPVYRHDFSQLEKFERNIHGLLDQLETYEKEYPAYLPTLVNRRQVLAGIVETFNQKGPYRANIDDVALLLGSGDAAARRLTVERSLLVLAEIYREGMHDQSLASAQGNANLVTVFQVVGPEGEIVQRSYQSLEEGMSLLRSNLKAEGMPVELATALFRLFRNGLVPNIVFDKESTEKLEQNAIRSLRPVTVAIARGQLLVEAGQRVTEEQAEMLAAHRGYLHDHDEEGYNEGLQLLSRIVIVLAMVAAGLLYIRLEDPETLGSNSRVGLLALVLVINLALVRLTYSMLGMDFFVHDTSWAATLPFLAPTALAPLIVAILIDVGSATFMALFISLFTGVIYGNRVDVQVLTFLSSVVAIYGCRSVRRRSSVVRASAAGALVLSFSTLLLGIVAQTPIVVLVRQMSAGLLTGMVTGIVVVGLLPVLESVFRRTTDITLLELTDYNHPLMRTMQMDAPGTYHHSLVVAQLSENAAAVIGGNPLQARVCALYHDIGKTDNPAFFTENQQMGARNPHDLLSPEDSARIIIGHVTAGLVLARKHHLPKAVVEAIQQHHGRTLVRYFYQKALEQIGLNPAPSRPPFPGSPAAELAAKVDADAFRYPGPLPSTKESAIICLADCVEAASRSMKVVTPEALENLIDTLVNERLTDGVLDEAPITLAQIAQVKESFRNTLLAMLHSRIAYPKAGGEGALALQ